jgi:outer membrane protein assembly factor BamB
MLSLSKRRILAVFSLIMLLALAGCDGPASQQSPSTPTPVPSKLLYVETHNGISAIRTIDGKVAWTYPLPSTIYVAYGGFPFIVANGAIYLATNQQIVALKTDTGKQLWTVPNSGEARSIVATQESVFVSVQGGLLYAFDSQTGTLKWRQTQSTDLTSLQLLVGNDLLYIWHDAVLIAIDPKTGNSLWTNESGESIYYPVQKVFLTKTTLIVIRQGFTRGLDPESGHQKWAIDGNVNEFLVANDILYLGMSINPDIYTVQNSLAAYDTATGHQKWSVADDDVRNKAVTFGPDGFFSVGGPSEGDLTARNLQDGQQLWTKPGTGTYSSVNEDNGILYAVNGQHGLEAFTARDGKPLWTYPDGMSPTFFDHEPYLMGEPLIALDATRGQRRWQSDVGPISNTYFQGSS